MVQGSPDCITNHNLVVNNAISGVGTGILVVMNLMGESSLSGQFTSHLVFVLTVFIYLL